MHLKQLPKFVYACYRARRVPFLWGPRGVGKSEGIAQAAIEIGKKIGDKNFGLIDLRLGTQEVGDLIGLPRVREISSGVWRTVWSKPEWWPEKGTNGIIFLDEFNRAGTNDVIQAMFQFVLGSKDKDGKIIRHLHTHLLPEGWSIVCAGNPDTSDYSVQSIDTAMLDRFIQVEIAVDKKVSVKWMQQNLKNDEIWKYVQAAKDSLGKIESIQMVVSPSPRSYEFIDDMLTVLDEKDFNNFGFEVLSGIIGPAQGMILYKQLKNSLLKALTAREVLDCKDFEKFKKEIISKYLTKSKVHLELMDITLKDILKEIEESKLNAEQYMNINRFLKLLPADMGMGFFREGVVLQEKLIPLMETLMPEENDEYMMELINAMGFSKETVEETLIDLEKINEAYIAELAKAKTQKKGKPSGKKESK